MRIVLAWFSLIFRLGIAEILMLTGTILIYNDYFRLWLDKYKSRQ